jgi:hypothetical protein
MHHPPLMGFNIVGLGLRFEVLTTARISALRCEKVGNLFVEMSTLTLKPQKNKDYHLG